jgi:hypothetical protein
MIYLNKKQELKQYTQAWGIYGPVERVLIVFRKGEKKKKN